MDLSTSTHRVDIRFVGKPPIRQLKRASGVDAVAIDGPLVRCIVLGSFQPFLEALRGHEVVTLVSTPDTGRTDHLSSTELEGDC